MRIASAATLLAVVGCQQLPPSGVMVVTPARPHDADPALAELARLQPADDERALLVVFPRSACSGTARTVLMDEDGVFVGAVGPGEAALLRLPRRTRTILAISSVDVVANPRTWFLVDDVDVPAAPAGVLLTTPGGRQCSKTGHYASAEIASKSELEAAIAETEITWLVTADRRLGQAWLDEHRERVDELTGRAARAPKPRPAVVTRKVFLP